MKKTLLIFILVFPIFCAAQKKVTASVEILPNYIWHILASSNVWDKSENPYGDQFGYTIPEADRRFFYDHRNLVAWGNSRGGMLAGGLFFMPLAVETSVDDYIAFLESLPAPDSLAAVCSEITRILKDNYRAFENEVWPGIKPKLMQSKDMIEASFAGTDPIATWERNLGMSFPGKGKVLVLSYANQVDNLPSANDLGPERNNFGIAPDENVVNYVYNTVLHEIGIFTFMPVINTLQSDPSLRTDFLQSGNVVYVACETFAEKRKDDIFGGEKRVFLPQWLDAYKWFYGYYEKNDRPDADIEKLLRNAIAEYASVFGPDSN